MKRLVFLETGSRTGLIFAPQDTAAIQDILTRATVVETNYSNSTLKPLEKSVDTSLVASSLVTADQKPEATLPPITETIKPSAELAAIAPDTVP